jgi:GT2 family glycosyltransferase
MSIPVLGIAYISQPNLLRELIGSIDYPVDRLVIIDNSPDGDAPVPDGAVHVVTGHNLGVSPSWNLILKSSPLSPWWAIVNSDMEFGEGDLARLDEAVHPGQQIYHMDGFAAYALTRESVERVGLFDENFVPAYFEDNDYHYRCHLLGVPTEQVPNGMTHVRSAVLKGSQHYQDENRRTFPSNADYYLRKWGGLPGRETFTTPFDRGGSPAQWEFDLARLVELTWR